MANDFYGKDNLTLIHVGEVLAQVAAGNPAYGLNKAATDAIAAEANALAQVLSDQAEAEAALRRLTEARSAARTALTAKLSSTAKTLEANPAITDAMLRAAALSARPAKGIRPTSLAAPTDLVADGFSDGTLALKWTPQNRTRVTYVVEVSNDGQSWSYLATTTKTRFSATGFLPGVAVWTRVFATNSTLSSPSSNVSSVYAPASAAAVQLKVA